MAGLTASGFEAETYENIKSRIEEKLNNFNPGFDFSVDSPDGQLISIMTFEIYQNWQQLNQVYNSYNPYMATGAGLRNIGLLSGLPYGSAQRSIATVQLAGTSGTVVPRNSQVSDADGNLFYISFDTTIPSNAQAVSVVPGIVPVGIGAITTIETPIAGWTGVSQDAAGTEGALAQSESEYRNVRQRTVMRNYTSTADTLEGRLVELGLGQAVVVNNTSTTVTLADGTPPNTVHVTVGELGGVAEQDVAQAIFDMNAIGCPTYGNQTVAVVDSQGVSHDVKFSTASQVSVELVVDVTYLSELTAGADDKIKTALFDHINSLPSGEDVIWSRLFSYITPYAKAQVNTVTVAKSGDTQGTANIAIASTEFAAITASDITLTVV
jgi:uncharacterized phage protein gp47/JayE